MDTYSWFLCICFTQVTHQMLTVLHPVLSLDCPSWRSFQINACLKAYLCSLFERQWETHREQQLGLGQMKIRSQELPSGCPMWVVGAKFLSHCLLLLRMCISRKLDWNRSGDSTPGPLLQEDLIPSGAVTLCTTIPAPQDTSYIALSLIVVDYSLARMHKAFAQSPLYGRGFQCFAIASYAAVTVVAHMLLRTLEKICKVSSRPEMWAF